MYIMNILCNSHNVKYSDLILCEEKVSISFKEICKKYDLDDKIFEEISQF